MTSLFVDNHDVNNLTLTNDDVTLQSFRYILVNVPTRAKSVQDPFLIPRHSNCIYECTLEKNRILANYAKNLLPNYPI